MFPAAFIGSYIGAGLTHRLPIQSIKMVFAVLVLIAAARMAWMTSQNSPLPATAQEVTGDLEVSDDRGLAPTETVQP